MGSYRGHSSAWVKLFFVALGVLALAACPLPYQFTPADASGNVAASNDPANPSVTAAPQLTIVEATSGSQTTDTTPSVDVAVHLESETPGAVIFYRTDGTKPVPGTAGTFIYSAGAPIEVSGHTASADIRAIAIGPSMYPSTVSAETVTVTYQAAPAPTFSPTPGDYGTDQNVVIASAVAGAQIYYTIADGAGPAPPPSPGDPGTMLYTGPVSISGAGTVKSIAAIAVADERLDSAVSQGTWTIGLSPAPTPVIAATNAGYYLTATITVTPAGADIFYTLDGSDPTDTANPARRQYTSPFRIFGPVLVRAYAVGNGYLASPVLDASFDVWFDDSGTYDNFDDESFDSAKWDAWHQLGGRAVEFARFQLANGSWVDTTGTANIYGHGQSAGWTGVGHLRSVAAGNEWTFTITHEYMGSEAGGTQGWGIFAWDPYDNSRVKLVSTYNDFNGTTPTNANYVLGGDSVGDYLVRRVGSDIEVYQSGQLLRTVDASSIHSVFQLYVTANNAWGVNVSYAAVAIDTVSVTR